MPIDHYENFPVASVLCPPELRPPIVAIYRFARTADDLADEGDAPVAARVDDLRAYRADLVAAARGDAVSQRWQTVFGPLRQEIARHSLPVPLLHDLLSAFERDLVQHRYGDRAELLDYCRQSANPVGRLLLHLHGVSDPASLAQSDQICSGLQLANFWQDLSVDTARGRLYVPLADCARAGVSPDDLLARRDGPAVRRLVHDLEAWARALLVGGSPLVHQVPGRAGWELRLVVQGGLRILDHVAASGHGSLLARPRLRAADLLTMGWRACRMRPPVPPRLRKARP